MARPTARDRHIPAALTGVSIGYSNGEYIGQQVFPRVIVQKQNDKFFIFDKSAWFRNEISPRAPGQLANRVDYSISTGSYICLPYALGKEVTDEEIANADQPLRPMVEAAEFTMDQLLLGLEIRVADLVSASGNWASASAHTSTPKWSSDTSTPTANILTLNTSVRQTIGRRPNTAVLGAEVFETLMDHPEFLERLKYTRAGAVLTPGDLASWFGYQKVLIGDGIKNTANEGAADSFSDIWSDFFWVGWVAPNPSLRQPSAGYVFEWGARETETFREDQEKQWIVTVEHKTDERITASDSGAIYSDLL